MPVDCLIKPGGTPPAAVKSPFAKLIPISMLLLSTERGRGSLGYSSNHPKIYYTNLLYEVKQMSLNVQAFLDTLPIMGKGMAGIFIVTGVIILAMILLRAVSDSDQKKN